MKSKFTEWITLFIIQLVLTIPFYTTNAYALTISNVNVAKVTASTAVIEWSTDTAANGKVKYGQTQSLGFTQRHEDFVVEHSVTVMSGINSDTTYFFSVESADAHGTTAVNNNSGNFFTFKTSDITPPPQVTGLKFVSTTPDSVSLTWNAVNASDLSHYVVHRNRVLIANVTTNSFSDSGLSQNTEFTYKVSAVDKSGNEGQLSDAVIASTTILDLTLPVISNVDVLPLTDATARITWLTDENTTTIVLYGINNTDKTKSSSELVTNHSIVIDGLVKNIKHIFTVSSCDKADNCANSSNHSFTAGKDVILPFINLSIPKCSNRRVIDIRGTTEPFTKVTLFVNDMAIPKRILSGNEIGADGKFTFTQIQLEQSNVIKIVMEDKSGNKNEKTFDVKLDLQEPVVQLNEIPSITSKSNVSISGTVNEQVIVKVFADANINVSSVENLPSQITGLNATKVGQNSVELKWNESKDKDFSHYVVHRSDIGAIATTKPANFNLFIDALVDSGKTYTYQVSAVNIFANEGPKSEPITVTTLKGGEVLNLAPPLVDIFEDFRKPLLVTNVTDKFNLGVKLTKGDGVYKIKAIFEDCAENNVIIQKNVKFDTKKPTIKIISPPSGALIFENVANEVDVIGKTEPNARVHLFVDRTPFSSYDYSIEVTTGLPNDLLPTQSQLTPQARLDADIRDLPIRLANISISEDKLDAKCRSAVSAASCRTGADRSVTADSEGNFKFEKVDLTVLFGGAGSIRQVSPTDFRSTQLNQEAKESKTTTLVVIATDDAAQRGTASQTMRIGTCWSGNQSWDVISLTQHQSPTFLSAERLAEGTETIYFYFKYNYIGGKENAKIVDVSLQKACGTREILDPRFNISCQILPPGGKARLNKPDNIISYSAITLSRFPGMDRFLEDDWKGFFKAINKELTFPFKVRITYEHEVMDEDGKIRKSKETQTTCEEVSYNVDNALLDFRKVLPDWLLFDAVDFLQDSIKTITKVQEQIGKVLDYVAIGCLSSFGAHLAVKIYRNWIELLDENLFKFKDMQLMSFKLDTEQKNQECKDIVKAIEKGYGRKLKYFSDADLEKCFPASASAWKAEAKIYQLQRWSCDRVFGHSAPSRWTETENDDELHRQITSLKTCASDLDEKGQRIRAEKCKDLEGRYRLISNPGEHQPFDRKCFQIITGEGAEGERFVYTFDGQQDPTLVNNKIYKLTRYEIRPREKPIYAVKITDDIYMTQQGKTCAEACGIKKGQEDGEKEIDGKKYKYKKAVQETSKKKKDRTILAGCITRNECRGWHAKFEKDSGGILIQDFNKVLKDYTIRSEGYTSDCFYDDNDKIEVISSTDPNEREVCCCINGKESDFKERYYQPLDTYANGNNVDVNTILAGTSIGQKTVHQSKVSSSIIGEELKPPEKHEDMKWSYRYSRIGFLGKKYNPNRYIEGRDLPACFGLNNIFYQYPWGKERELLTVDPFKQDTAALQCLFLTGINQRLQLIKNIMNVMSTCLIQVRTTGRADTGVCKELFTQHVCDLIWQGIRWVIDGCTPENLGISGELLGEETQEKYTDYVKIGFKGILQGISETQAEISEEYGNAKLNDLFGTGSESVARKVCLGAFGYDWLPNARDLVDAAYSAPYATLVQAITRSREFLTVEPVSVRPKYEYRASWLINPGCDLERYDVQLACVSRKEVDEYPNSIDCGALGAPSIAYTGRPSAGQFPLVGPSTGYNQCDCLELPQEQTTPFFSESRLKQNSLIERNHHKVIESNRRYDHLKFILRTDRRIPSNAKSNCFPTGYDKGFFYFPLTEKTARDIADCTVQPLSGEFSCTGGVEFFNRKGTAELLEVTINGENADRVKELSIGDPLRIGAKIRKTGQDKCLRVKVEPDPILPIIDAITINGTSDIAPITITDSLRVAGRSGEVLTDSKISFKLLEQNNQDIVTIKVDFISKNDPIFNFNDPKDEALIETLNDELKPIADLLKDGKLIITKGNARIQITAVALNPPTVQGNPHTLSTVIRINPPQQTSQTSQRKTISVELFHLKDDRDSYSNPEDCSFNDKITERTNTIAVIQQKGVGAATLVPSIITQVNPQKSQFKGEPIVISAKITHTSGIERAELSLTDSSGQKVFQEPNIPRDGDKFQIELDTSSLEIGKYIINIKAFSRATASSDSKLSDKSFEYEIKLPKG